MKTTLGEWGKKLPVGMVEGSKFNREFDFRKLNLGVEREIQNLCSQEKVKTHAPHATIVLAKLLTSLGGQRLDPAKPDEARTLLAKCWLADVLYMWMWARRMSCGNQLEINFPCGNPRCEHLEDPAPIYDIDSFDVTTADSVEQLEGQWVTKTPYDIRGQEVKLFRLQPPTWSVYMDADATEADMGAKILIASICGTDKHETIRLTDHEVDQLERPDYVGARKQVDKLVFGPKLEVEHECPKCHHKDTMFLDWTYESFFS